MNYTFTKLLPVLLVVFGSLVSPCVAYEIAKDFTVYNRATGEALTRKDFEGKVLILDFIAYWCEPCKFSSPQIQQMVESFRAAGGNKHGVEVVALAVNVEAKNPKLTDQFISEVGFDLVADSFDWKEDGTGLYAQFRDGGLPHFTIINGVAGNNFQQWAVLGDGDGFYPLDTYEDIINTVRRPGTERPNIQVETNEQVVRYTPQKYRVFNRDELSFLSSKLGTSDFSRELKIVNSGNKSLKLNRIYKTGLDLNAFEIEKPAKSILAPGQQARLKIKFKPTKFGPSKATLVIKSNDPTDPTFSIKLNGKTVEEFDF